MRVLMIDERTLASEEKIAEELPHTLWNVWGEKITEEQQRISNVMAKRIHSCSHLSKN